MKNWGETVISGWEADDEASIRAARCRADGVEYCIATIDKDLDQIPGLHYGYSKHVFYDMSEADAETFFWEQCVSGDTTDGIQGCFKVGAGKAKTYIAKWTAEYDEAKGMGDVTLQEYLWERVVNTYEVAICAYPDKYPEEMLPVEAALETARLVKMLDYEYQRWMPPGTDDGTLS